MGLNTSATFKTPLAIVALGAVGASGLNARALSAAVWSNLARHTLCPGDPYGLASTLRLSFCPLFDNATPGAMRMQDMYHYAAASMAWASSAALPLYLVSPHGPTRPTLPSHWAGPLSPAYHVQDGAGGWLHALCAIADAAMQSPVGALYALAGVDSLLDENTVHQLSKGNTSQGKDGSEGLVLGEGAAILHLCSLKTAHQGNLNVLGVIHAGCHVPFDSRPADALTLAAQQALQAFAGAPVHSLLWDLAEDDRYLNAMATTLFHLPDALAHVTLLRPSKQLGSIGAAFGPVAAVLALEGCRTGVTAGERTLICTLHEGQATAVALTAPCRPHIMLQDAPGEAP